MARVVEPQRDGTAHMTLSGEELLDWPGPIVDEPVDRMGRSRRDLLDQATALCRVQVFSADDIEAEVSGASPRLPWLRDVDRRRAVVELHRLGAGRELLEHAAATPVVSIDWDEAIVLGWLEPQEDGSALREAHLCSDGGMLLNGLTKYRGDVRDAVRAIPADDPHRRERAALLLGAET